MKLLLQKDRPWIVGFAVAGTIALAAALCERSGLYVFVVGQNQLEAAFHVAWIAGLLLGAVAACFDEILGTREFLQQRPVSCRRIAVARAAGCAVVLATWFLLAPIGAWLVFALFDRGSAGETRWVALSMIHGTSVVAVSSCAIGLAAGALPCGWLTRLVIAACWYLAAFGGVHWLTANEGLNSFAPYCLAHFVVAAIALGAWWTATSTSHDADRPWPPRVRAWTAVLMLVASAQLWTAVDAEAQSEAIAGLKNAWPEVLEFDGRVMLVDASGRESVVVDASHRPNGQPLPARHVKRTHHDLPGRWGGASWGFDAPRWHAERIGAGGFTRGRLVCSTDGRAWVMHGFDGRARRTGKGSERLAFEPAVRLLDVRDDVLAWEPEARRLWRYDPDEQYFVPVTVPADDPVVGLDTYLADKEVDPAELHVALQPSGAPGWRYGGLGFVRGTRRGYVLAAGKLEPVDGLLVAVERSEAESRQRKEKWVGPDYGGDPFEVHFTLPATVERPEFRHVFVPRTPREQWHAGSAVVMSLLRPPLLQAIVHLSDTPVRVSWLTDRLVVGGRRSWLVGATIAVAAALAWSLHRRLRRLGAATAVIRFWMAATLLLGPVAFFVHFLFERRRAWARQTVVEPARPPRIVTPHVAAGVSP